MTVLFIIFFTLLFTKLHSSLCVMLPKKTLIRYHFNQSTFLFQTQEQKYSKTIIKYKWIMSEETSFRVFVGGLAPTVTEEELG